MMINQKNQKSNKLFNEWKKVVNDADKNLKIPMILVKIRDNKTWSNFYTGGSIYPNILIP